jgi:outer membrane protein assembly factor BamB
VLPLGAIVKCLPSFGMVGQLLLLRAGQQGDRVTGDKKFAGASLAVALIVVESVRLLASPTVFAERPRRPALATAYHVNPQHNGFSRARFLPPLRRLWARDLGGTVSYPLIARGKVFVSVRQDSGNRFLALDKRDGSTLWSRSLEPLHVANATYGGGSIFLTTSQGVLVALDADTGRRHWSTNLYREGSVYTFGMPPTAANSRVFVSAGGVGGTIFSVSQNTGRVQWSAKTIGASSSPTVAGNRLFVSYIGPQTYGFEADSGNRLWWLRSTVHGGGSSTAAYARGRVYASESTGLVLAGRSGRIRDAYVSRSLPAIHGNTALFLENRTLHAVERTTHSHRWFFRGDGHLVTSPVIVKGYAYIGSTQGRLFGLSLATGRVVWEADAGSGIYPPPHLTDPAAGLGLLVVPAQNRLVAYGGQPR